MHADAPCFLWWPKDYQADVNVQRMSWEEQGVYRHLIDVCWLEGGVPADVESLRRILCVTKAKAVRLRAVLEPCFAAHPDRPGWWQHGRVEQERQKQQDKSVKRMEAGRKGAAKRWENHGKAKANG